MPITPPSARTLTSTPVPPSGRRGTRFASPIAPRASWPSPATDRVPITLKNSRLFMIPSSNSIRFKRRVHAARNGPSPPPTPAGGPVAQPEISTADRLGSRERAGGAHTLWHQHQLLEDALSSVLDGRPVQIS